MVKPYSVYVFSIHGYIFGNLACFTGFIGHRSFLTAAVNTIHCSSKLFIALLLRAHDAVTDISLEHLPKLLFYVPVSYGGIVLRVVVWSGFCVVDR